MKKLELSNRENCFKQAYEILERDGIFHDENTLFGKLNLAKHYEEIINELYSMGYEGELKPYGNYFEIAGEIAAIYDEEIFGEFSEVKEYIKDYIRETYKEELAQNPDIEL
ncbi:hypothetical protein [Peribacillus simplex]|uniref:Uncharacterized protein n=1 Tax=Peribacillus simplex TaxID=1478 RepID=A0A9W4KWN0_9BACI|nr:hypothetical protein [Peribacillus simplex]CAH0186246.1 hypothetical protein SRABI133_01551 [Peribacillus simplex]